jgi:hypothetical protein
LETVNGNSRNSAVPRPRSGISLKNGIKWKNGGKKIWNGTNSSNALKPDGFIKIISEPKRDRAHLPIPLFSSGHHFTLFKQFKNSKPGPLSG